ncbi:glycosyltransferase family 2 protein [Nocardia huaxiensis]|uniref:Glycosyltransferase family 2 protein n=1 Tax=Nocardia huaxiensis TaxID=2755382 RepID=A0A7D6ZDS3_9NOCA|nr:glycosyltransferase family A protein [Nocardia huaxiensis]QLY27727.1 glycosyltransferase family 2 protein [Nocardia huaxiensis]
MGTQPPPAFSFLTTAYKTEDYLRDTIDSVVAQTIPDWELVVVDNGMSDEIAAIVGEYAASDRRIRLVRQENKGYDGGVMAAAAAATGRYFVVLDSDDQVLPGYCETIQRAFDAEPDIAAVGCDAVRFDDTGADLPVGYYRSTNVKQKPDPTKRLRLADLLGGLVPYYTAAVRREAWEAVGGYDRGGQELHESVAIWIRMVRDYDIRVLPQRLARFRIRSDSMSRDPAKVEAFMAELERSFAWAAPEDPEAQAALDKTLRTFRYHVLLRRAQLAFLDRDDKAAAQAAKDAFGQRKTVRAAAIVAAVSLFPGALRRVHPVKQEISGRVARVAGRVVSAVQR